MGQVLVGEGVGWLKLNRLKKLMEDEQYRMLVISKLNKTLDKKIAPDDHIDDIVSVMVFNNCSNKSKEIKIKTKYFSVYQNLYGKEC